MGDFTTIQVERRLLSLLGRMKQHPRQSYNEVISSLVKGRKGSKMDQYDGYLHNIQKKKMKELWDNDADEAWEHV